MKKPSFREQMKKNNQKFKDDMLANNKQFKASVSGTEKQKHTKTKDVEVNVKEGIKKNEDNKALGCCVSVFIILIVAIIWAVRSNNKSTDNNSIQANKNQSQPSPTIDLQKQAEENKKKLEEALANLKNNAETIPYKTLYRDIESNKGKSVHYTGKVIQVISGILPQMRVNITQDKYGYWNDTVLIDDFTLGKHPKILDDDIIEFWGTVQGETSYTSVLGATISLPEIKADIIEVRE